jgi:hypothetical protein
VLAYCSLFRARSLRQSRGDRAGTVVTRRPNKTRTRVSLDAPLSRLLSKKSVRGISVSAACGSKLMGMPLVHFFAQLPVVETFNSKAGSFSGFS